MEHVEIREVNMPTAMGLQVSAEPYLAALSMQYADRGLARAVRESAEAQIARERETCASYPEAYRLSEMSDAAIAGIYRQGKDTMSASDLVRYFSEMRAEHLEAADFSQDNGMDAIEEGETLAIVSQPKTGMISGVKEQMRSVSARVKESFPTWFNTAKADLSKEKRRFPLSAFASIAAIAASLMLIVASSIMVTRSEEELSALRREADIVAAEVAEMRSDMNVDTDLLEIRRLAVEEYGMIEEEYLKTEYISLRPEEKVEAFEEERDGRMGLGAILSAIGIGR